MAKPLTPKEREIANLRGIIRRMQELFPQNRKGRRSLREVIELNRLKARNG